MGNRTGRGRGEMCFLSYRRAPRCHGRRGHELTLREFEVAAVPRGELFPHARGRAPVSRDCGLEGVSDLLRAMRSHAENGRFFETGDTIRRDVAIIGLLRSV